MEALEELLEERRKIEDKKFWEEIVKVLRDSELDVAFSVFSYEFFKRHKHRIKQWIRSRVEKAPEIRTARVLEEIEKIFKLPVSYDDELRKELKLEIRRAKKAAYRRRKRYGAEK